jgi:phosphoglycolate phosphatase
LSTGVQALLLDLDGTLIDSRQDLAAATNRLLAEVGLAPLPLETVCSYVGRGARALVRRALEAADPDGRVPRSPTVLRRFLGHYEQVLLDSTVAFPGVREGLVRLRSAGVGLAVVTNKPIAPTRRILDGLDLAEMFTVILGGDSLATKKPDPALLIAAASALSVRLDGCLMVGDSDVDMEAAANAGVQGVWCSWGGIHPDRPASFDRVAHSFDEIVSLALSP